MTGRFNLSDHIRELAAKDPRFRFIQQINRTTRLQGIVETFYELEINEHRLRDSDNFLGELEQIFNKCIEFAIAEHSKSDHTASRIRLILTAPGLLIPINLPYMRINELTAERIWMHIENFTPSHSDIVLGKHLHFHFQFAK